jgi:hypothetical protein
MAARLEERHMNEDKGTTEKIHLPQPSVWPAVCGAGIALMGFGLVTSLFFSAVGVLVMGWSLVGWIGELCHD